MSSDLSTRLAGMIRRQRWYAPGQTILVAVSGGLDSMALLRLLTELAPTFGWRLQVAHFNHQLRGRASAADEALVRRAARRLGWPCRVGRADVAAVAARLKISTEMAARARRHAFFGRVAARQGCGVLALAHHADDQVEQCFLRLLRGAGGAGLAGMTTQAPSPHDARLTLVRPLLSFTKQELRAYAGAAGLVYREDASNRSNDPLRNRIRNELLPRLRREYQPGLDAAVLRAMEITGAESGWVRECARLWRQRRDNPGAGQGPATPSFDNLAPALQRQALQLELTDLGLEGGFEWIEALRSGPGWVRVRATTEVRRRPDGTLETRHWRPLRFDQARISVDLGGRQGGFEFGGGMFRWRAGRARGYPRGGVRAPWTEYFDADRVGARIVLRHWRPGDRFQPSGMPGTVKLQDLLVNAGVPVAVRRELVVATTQAGVVFWVEGLRIGEAFKIRSETRRELVWVHPPAREVKAPQVPPGGQCGKKGLARRRKPA